MSMGASAWVFKAFVTILLSGLAMAIVIPLLRRQGIATDQWIVVPIVAAVAAAVMGPGLLRALRKRRERPSSFFRSR